MAVVALIACTKRKENYGCAARELYSKSNLFRLSYELATLVADKIFILSAKHELVTDDEFLEPYDETLKIKSTEQRDSWALKVIDRLSKCSDLKNDCYVILAGKIYYERLLPHLESYWLPLKGIDIFYRPKTLQELISIENSVNMAYILHKLFYKLPRYNWQTINDVPYGNGIYIMFETGASYFDMDRITRVGSHPSQARLKQRLKDHFVKKNKDGSIFRKNIGRAILNKDQNPYIDIWNLDLSKSENKKKYGHLVDYQLQNELEKKTSDYLRNSFSFVCIPVEDSLERICLENSIIASLNSDKTFGPGGDWLGLNSPIVEIVESGLWNVRGLNSKPLSDVELERVKYLIRFSDKGDFKYSNQSICEKAPGSGKNISKENFRKANKANDIRQYLNDSKQEAKAQGKIYIELVSGEIHGQLGMKNRLPQVCNIMYEKMGARDKVLHTTPSGYSSTIKIRYYLE